MPDRSVQQQFVIGAATVVVAAGSILYAGEAGIALLYFACFTVIAGIFAYRFPVLIIVAWALIALYTRHTAGAVSMVGGVDVRPTDPVLFAMSVAVLIALLTGDDRTRQSFMGPGVMWAVLMAWIGFQVMRSVPAHGIVSTLGELRSTFQSVLMVPYIVIFIRTREQQRRLLHALLLLSVVFVAAALLRGALQLDFMVLGSRRWMVAQVNLALVLSVAGWYIARRTEVLQRAEVAYFLILFASLVLVITSHHRSVWLASGGIICALACFKLISPGKLVGLLTGLVLAGLTIDLLTADIHVMEFLRGRMTAFTSFRDDATASWRFELWSAGLEQLRTNPILGKGLGSYFYIQLPSGVTVTAPPHNLYIQLSLQLGFAGLLLYAAFVASAFRYLWVAQRLATDELTFTLTLYGIVALVGSSLFYVAYGFDVFSWLVVGLGLAAALTASTSNRLSAPVRAAPASNTSGR